MSEETKINKRIKIIGCGKMASAILDAWLKKSISPQDIYVDDPKPSEWLLEKKKHGLNINTKADVSFDYCFIGVKPQSLDEIKQKLKGLSKKNITFVQLLSPTTSKDRMKKIINDSHEMIYYISMLSTTGGKLKVSPKKILQNYNKIKRINPKKNLVIGFGITEKTISSLKSANGLVVGSMLCKIISKSLKMRQNPVTKLAKVVYSLKKKIL